VSLVLLDQKEHSGRLFFAQ